MGLTRAADSTLEAAAQRYVAAFAQRDTQGETPWSHKLRQTALDSFAAQGFPSTRNEEWKYTDVRPVAELDARLASTQYLNGLAVDGVANFGFGNLQAHRLTFVNGCFAPQLSQVGELLRCENRAQPVHRFEHRVYAGRRFSSCAQWH
jgi:hypothetical protein